MFGKKLVALALSCAALGLLGTGKTAKAESVGYAVSGGKVVDVSVVLGLPDCDDEDILTGIKKNFCNDGLATVWHKNLPKEEALRRGRDALLTGQIPQTKGVLLNTNEP